MNEQIPNTNPPQPEKPKTAFLKDFLARIMQILTPYIEKFKKTRLYTNKKFFYPLVALFILFFLTIVAGILFGGKKTVNVVKTRPTPTPLILETQQTPTPSGDPVSLINGKLLDLKTQIDSLDVKQSRLQPPTIDFKISF